MKSTRSQKEPSVFAGELREVEGDELRTDDTEIKDRPARLKVQTGLYGSTDGRIG